MTVAQSYELVERGSSLFIPVHWQSLSPSPLPPRTETIWLPLSRRELQQIAYQKHSILFANDSELRNFEFMAGQIATDANGSVGVLIKTDNGLKKLDERGKLVDPTGEFSPNYIRPMLNENEDDKKKVYDTIVEWVGGVEDAESLLRHLATSLAPNYSAVKYVLLLGEGRNGKSVLLSMLTGLFGKENVSNVTRQMMAERNPTCVELNNKLLNVIFDGEMAYIKDSSMEKTLIAGEPGHVRMLYESVVTEVQTNALFIEALNIEPKVRDKSPALQKRLVRFRFPNVYSLDRAFSKLMTSEPMLGALLSLLIDRFVREEELAEHLTLTKSSLELQVEQVFLGSPLLQFLDDLQRKDPSAFERVIQGKLSLDAFMASFKPWISTQNISERSDSDLLVMVKNSAVTGSGLLNGRRVPIIKSLKPETLEALKQLRGEDPDESGNSDTTVVGD